MSATTSSASTTTRAKATSFTNGAASPAAPAEATQKAMTVLGPIAAEELGGVLMNERILQPTPTLAQVKANPTNLQSRENAKVTIDNLATIREFPFLNHDNMMLSSLHQATQELQLLNTTDTVAAASTPKIITILDTTPCTLSRDHVRLQTLAQQLNLNIIIGTTPHQLAQMKDWCSDTNNVTTTIQAATNADIERMEHELKYGGQPKSNKDRSDGAASDGKSMNTTADKSQQHEQPPIRPGFIGELVVGAYFTSISPKAESSLSDYDVRQIKACAVVQHTTQAPLLLAVPLTHAMTTLDLIETSGGYLSKVVLTRMDYYCHNYATTAKSADSDDAFKDILFQILDRKVHICLDRMGVAPVIWDLDGKYPSIVPHVINMLKQVLQHNPGYIHQILFSSGVHMKLQYRQYGGLGYNLVTQQLVPRLLQQGVLTTTNQLHTILVTNPQRLLTWWTPPPVLPPPKEYIPCSICNKMFEPILGTYYTKYTFTYCGTDCLKRHRLLKFCPVDQITK